MNFTGRRSLLTAALQVLAPLKPFAGPPTQARSGQPVRESVARNQPLPLTLYLRPGPGADVSIPFDRDRRLPMVQFIKESSRDLARVSQLIVMRSISAGLCARYFHHHAGAPCRKPRTGRIGRRRTPPAAEIARYTADRGRSLPKITNARRNCSYSLPRFPANGCTTARRPPPAVMRNLIGVPVGDPYPPYAPLSRDDLKQRWRPI